MFLAVVFAAWYGGIGPSIVTIVLGASAILYWFLPPYNSFAVRSPAEIFGLLAFLLLSTVIAALGEATRRQAAKRERAEADLRKERENLEARIDERTSKLNAANRSLRELSGRLMQIRDDESRRLARELHDSVGQLLAALSMNNAVVGDDLSKLSPAAARAFSENAGLINQISAEIRTISHLLHPPLLDEAGLASALRWYVEGFSERSGIKVDLEMPPDLVRLPKDAEISVFRIVQECLTNIHKHSDSPTAVIRVVQQGRNLRLEIEDAGKGVPPEKQSLLTSSGPSGVGVSGMRERLGQLGGSLELHSDANGTRVTATLPIESSVARLREIA